MNIDDLDLLLEVVRQGSFAAVARRRGLDPSSVSRTVANIEARLNIRVFQRTTRTLSLTEPGERYVQALEPLLEGLQKAQDDALELRTAPEGMLRVTSSVAYGHTCITPLLAEFKQRFPGIRLELLFSDHNIDLVGEAVDLAVRLSPRVDSHYAGRQLCQTRYRVCVAPHYSGIEALVCPESLAEQKCLTFMLAQYKKRWRFREQGGHVRDVNISADISSSNAMTIKSCALQGLGPALLPDWLIAEDIAAGRLVSLFDEFDVTATDFSTGVWLLFPSREFLPSKTRVMIDFLLEKLAN